MPLALMYANRSSLRTFGQAQIYHVRAGVELVIDLRRAPLPATDAQGHVGAELDGRERAVLLRRDRDTLYRGRTIAAVHLFGFAVVEAANGTVHPLGEQGGDERVRAGAVLRAEPSAHVILDHTDAREREIEGTRHVTAGAEDPLRRLPHGQTVALPLRARTVRLERGVELDRRAELAGDHHIGGGEPCGHVAAFHDDRGLRREVARRLDPRCVRCGGVVERGGEGERLIRDGDRACGALGIGE